MKTLPKLLLYFVSITGLCLMSVAIIMACADEPDPYDYYTSFFHPDIQGQKEYGAFYFTDYKFTYGDEEPASEAAINSAEWAKYLGADVKPADVEKIMYHLDSAGKERAFHFFEQDPAAADSLTSNSFFISLKEPGHDHARKYYQFAVEAELLGQSNYNYWEPAPVDTAGLKDEAATAVQSAMEENDSFLKLRYFYQAQKLNHYAGDFEEAKKIFDQHIATVSSSSHIKGWALALKAGEERRLGDTIQAAYLFSKVFAGYPERRLQAYRNYHYIDAPFDQVIKLAQTPREKANLYAIKGFANPEIETDNLEEVYDNAPTSSLVGVLLLREINKLEQYYLTPALNNNTDQFYSDRSGLSKKGPEAHSASKKWILWVAAATILLAGILFILAFKKQEGKAVYKVLAGALLFSGALAVVWFYFSQQPQAAGPKSLPQGSFFVAMPDSVKTKYEAHIEKLRNFCTKLSSDGRYTEPQIGDLTSAYLYFIQNKPDDGLAALQKSDGQRLSQKLNDQKQIVKLLLSSQHIKQLKAIDEVALLPSLKWLDEKSDHNNQFAITQRNFYTHVLAPAYLRQGDTARAALVMLNSDLSVDNKYKSTEMPGFWYNYLHSAQLQQVIDWKNGVSGDQYLDFLSHGLKRVKADNLFELLGTIALREHRYSNAVAAFQHIRDRKIITKPYNGEDVYSEGESYQGDPFMVDINDYPKYFGGKRYTKLTFAQKMAELESQLRSDPKNSTACFQLANGLYNTSMYGNSWGLIAYSWSINDVGRKQLYYYDRDYINASQAKQYYLEARELSHDPELKAKCTFMAAKCEQKEHVYPSFMDDYDSYVEREKQYAQRLRENSYFSEMQQYKKTAFYQKAVNECSYLSDFITSD
ncbi:hypothetical protein [Pedobacter sp. MR2016-24]|uniref:hypothetical protein n=1 Tax=Pedobacter sp. MR2016-24 TaxID=2994466 RepID=UPI00224813D4|nr:hypothetical protein [Pedobacter sp. MR2016-24]MCX2483774.1 hypothetical protein [Pedobacter sp. MR2016-24]